MELDDSDENGEVSSEIVAGDWTRSTMTGQIERNDPPMSARRGATRLQLPADPPTPWTSTIG